MPLKQTDHVVTMEGIINHSDIEKLSTIDIKKVLIKNISFLEKEVLITFFHTLIANDRIKKIILLSESQEIVNEIGKLLPNRIKPLSIQISPNLDDYPLFGYPKVAIILSYGNWDYEWQEEVDSSSNNSEIVNGVMTFRYEKKTICTLHVTNNVIDRLILGEFIDPNTHVPENINHAKLIKQIVNLRNHTNYEELIQKVFGNYLTGPKVDYLDYRLGDGLIISDCHLNDDLYRQLFTILDKEGIQHSKMDKAMWLRDFAVSSYIQTFIQEEKSVDDEILINACDLAAKNTRGYFAKNMRGGEMVGSAGTNNGEPRRKFLLEHCQKNDIDYQSTKLILDGGNLITIQNNNKIYLLAGKNLLLINAFYRTNKNYSDINEIQKFLRQFFSNKKTTKSTEFYKVVNASYCKVIRDREQESIEESIHVGHIKEAKQAFARTFNISKKQIIWLENPDFHIDLFITPGPDNIIFLNNFVLLSTIALQDYQKTFNDLSQKIAFTALEFENEIGHILFDIKLKLIAKGFKVVDLPGTIFVRDEATGEYPCIANFMNSLTGFGKGGHYFITFPCEIAAINDELVRILKQSKVDNVYFVGTQEVVNEILKNEGALRCLSIPATSVGNLSSSHGFKKKIPITSDPNHSLKFFSTPDSLQQKKTNDQEELKTEIKVKNSF